MGSYLQNLKWDHNVYNVSTFSSNYKSGSRTGTYFQNLKWDDNRVFLKVTPVFTLSLGLLSPPIPYLSEVRKVREFYSIWIWNAETQHSVHKVRGSYSSCTGRSSENTCSSNGGNQEKGKWGGQNRMKLSLPQKKMVHFWVSRPLEG